MNCRKQSRDEKLGWEGTGLVEPLLPFVFFTTLHTQLNLIICREHMGLFVMTTTFPPGRSFLRLLITGNLRNRLVVGHMYIAYSIPKHSEYLRGALCEPMTFKEAFSRWKGSLHALCQSHGCQYHLGRGCLDSYMSGGMAWVAMLQNQPAMIDILTHPGLRITSLTIHPDSKFLQAPVSSY